MAADAKTTGKTFLAEVLAKLPEGQRAAVQTAFEAAEAAGALEVLGGGVLRQTDYSAEMDSLQAWKGQLDDWYAAKQADLVELKELKEGKRTLTGVPTPTPTPGTPTPGTPTPLAVDPSKFLSREEFTRQQAETERGAVAFIAEMNRLSLEHYKTFGEILDTDKILTDKRVQQLGLRATYNELHKDQLTAKATAEQKAREDTLRAEGAAAERQRLASTHQPFPVTGNEVSALSGIEAARAGQTPQVASVDDMAAEYARLQGART